MGAQTWKVVLAFVGIFIAGTVTGSLLTLRVAKELNPRGGPRPPGSVEQFGPTQLRRLAERLELTDEQRARIEPIVERAGEELGKIRRDSLRSSREIFDRMHAEVGAVLTPEQKEELEKMRTEWRERTRHMIPDRGRRSEGRSDGGRPGASRPDRPPGDEAAK